MRTVWLMLTSWFTRPLQIPRRRKTKRNGKACDSPYKQATPLGFMTQTHQLSCRPKDKSVRIRIVSFFAADSLAQKTADVQDVRPETVAGEYFLHPRYTQ